MASVNHSLRPAAGRLARGLAAAALALGLAVAAPGAGAAEPTVKIGVLKFGTVNWLMDVIETNGLDRKQGFALDMVALAGKDATNVALQAGDVDVITTDWFWALRARGEGQDIVFAPYSSSLGAVIVPQDSAIASLGDLVGKRIGVAGGPLDKSWLLLRGYGQKEIGKDLEADASPAYGAPPLLSEQLLAGNLDAVLTYWPFAARLEGAGLKQVLGVPAMMDGLDIKPNPPLVGFVWSTSRLAERGDAIGGFLRAVAAANEILATSDAEWDRIRPLMQVDSDGAFEALKARYREGIVKGWTAADTEAAGRLYETLARLGGKKLVGDKTRFDPAVFWTAAP
jgi:NitT/TauT family transport system substrate-binding protein